MNSLLLSLLLLLPTGRSALTTLTQTPSDAIVGEWLSAKKDSRVVIYRQADAWYGRITWGTGGSANDEKNPNPALRNRAVIGLVILNKFRYDGDNTWQDGTIYDPRQGKTYACKLTLTDANTLSIRGYVGLSLFGRTEIWSRFR